jgi:uncharacterized protein with PQ loop repeat
MVISFPAFSATNRLERALNIVSMFTLVMTVPQVLSIWIHHTVAGVSLLSWSSYLIAALLWMIHGVRKRDRSIYLPCIGWIILDLAIVIGLITFRGAG